MELTVTIEKILDVQDIKKKDGSAITKYGFVGKTQGRYAKLVKFDVFNQERYNAFNLEVGKTFAVSFEAESKEWKGSWFTTLVAWKAVRV